MARDRLQGVRSAVAANGETLTNDGEHFVVAGVRGHFAGDLVDELDAGLRAIVAGGFDDAPPDGVGERVDVPPRCIGVVAVLLELVVACRGHRTRPAFGDDRALVVDETPQSLGRVVLGVGVPRTALFLFDPRRPNAELRAAEPNDCADQFGCHHRRGLLAGVHHRLVVVGRCDVVRHDGEHRVGLRTGAGLTVEAGKQLQVGARAAPVSPDSQSERRKNDRVGGRDLVLQEVRVCGVDSGIFEPELC